MSTLFEAFTERASRHPDKLALVTADERLGYARLARRVEALAAGLATRLPGLPGLPEPSGPPRPLLLIARDSPTTVALALAASRLGLCLAPVNPKLGVEQLRTARRSVSAALVLHDAASADKAHAVAAGDCPALDIESIGIESADSESADSDAPDIGPVRDAAARPYLLTLSSGSTGDPKPVVFTDAGKRQRALLTAAEFAADEDDVILCASPFFHSLGQRLTFMPLVLGATLVQLPAFSADAWLEAVSRHAVTFTICVSSHLVALLDTLVGDDPRIASVRALVSSSANIDLATKRALFAQERFDFFEMYGASEVATATRLSRQDPPAKAASVGRPCAGVEVRVLDADGQACAAGARGQIAVRSPLASPGYFGRPDLDAPAFVDGWFQTGDLGYLDEEGFLHFVDRASDVIVTGGSNVHPSDVESVVRAVPGVRDCLVVGVSDRYLGQAVVAVVVLPRGDDARVAERRLRRHCRSRLATNQQPLAWFFVDALPLNAAGKTDRKAVRAHHEALNLELSARFAGLGAAVGAPR